MLSIFNEQLMILCFDLLGSSFVSIDFKVAQIGITKINLVNGQTLIWGKKDSYCLLKCFLMGWGGLFFLAVSKIVHFTKPRWKTFFRIMAWHVYDCHCVCKFTHVIANCVSYLTEARPLPNCVFFNISGISTVFWNGNTASENGSVCLPDICLGFCCIVSHQYDPKYSQLIVLSVNTDLLQTECSGPPEFTGIRDHYCLQIAKIHK